MPPEMLGSAPHFLVADVRRAAEYYRNKLGFRISAYFFDEPPALAIVKRDRAAIQLSLLTGETPGSNRRWKCMGVDAYIRVDDVEALYAELTGRQAHIVAPPVLRSYGMREIEARDLDGYVICFGEGVAATA